MLSYYEILQINEAATQAEVKRAYRKLSKILHPDLNNNTPEATSLFRLLNTAYETLSNERNKYDKSNGRRGIETNSELLAIIEQQKGMIRDYKQIIQKKSIREKDLLREIEELKEIKKFPNVQDGELHLTIKQQQGMIRDYKEIIQKKSLRERN